MNYYTYEFEDKGNQLETYEWDNVWWEHADKTGTPRILYIGDSISCATRRIATSASNGEIYFDGLGTSKAVDNPYLCDTIRLFAGQQGERSAILFNNGLHGWHLDDNTGYRNNYEKIIKFLINEFPQTPILLLLTTAVKDIARNARVIVRNQVVCELAELYNLPVIDAYSVIDDNRDLISADGVHLSPDGYKLLGNELIKGVKKVLG